MERFSPMQAEKMKYSWKLFREDYYAANGDNSTITATSTTTSTTTTIDTASTTETTSTDDEGETVSSSNSVTNFGGFTTAALVAILMANIY